ncbi:response regulator [bacterium]|nr:response regulator [bacterium]
MGNQTVTILVVDNQPANLKVLFSLFKQQDFTVRIAESGELALKILTNFQPDIILLDVMMPGMDGFTTCKMIRKNPATADIPVIFITALDGIEDKASGFAAGGVDYITEHSEAVFSHGMCPKCMDEHYGKFPREIGR